MLPYFARLDCVHRSPSYTKPFGDGRIGSRIATPSRAWPNWCRLSDKSTNFPNLLVSEYRTRRRFPAPESFRMNARSVVVATRRSFRHCVSSVLFAPCLSTLSFFIRHIIILRAFPKMSRIATGRVIARVADRHSGVYRSIGQQVGKSMSRCAPTPDDYPPVTSGSIRAASPRPALVKSTLAYSSPKERNPFRRYWFSDIYGFSHDAPPLSVVVRRVADVLSVPTRR